VLAKIILLNREKIRKVKSGIHKYQGDSQHWQSSNPVAGYLCWKIDWQYQIGLPNQSEYRKPVKVDLPVY